MMILWWLALTAQAKVIDDQISPEEAQLYAGNTPPSNDPLRTVWKPRSGLVLVPMFEMASKNSQLKLVIKLDKIQKPPAPGSAIGECRRAVRLLNHNIPRELLAAAQPIVTDMAQVCELYRTLEALHMEAQALWEFHVDKLQQIAHSIVPYQSTLSERVANDRPRRFISEIQAIFRSLSGAASAEEVKKMRNILALVSQRTLSNTERVNRLKDMLVETVKTHHQQFTEIVNVTKTLVYKLDMWTLLVNNQSNLLHAKAAYTRAYNRVYRMMDIKTTGYIQAYTDMINQYTARLNERVLGLVFMSNHLLTPYVLSPLECQQFLTQAAEHLNEQFPGYTLTIQQCADLYGSNFGQVVRVEGTYYLILFLPVSHARNHFLVYRTLVINQPVTPESTNATVRITGLPPFVGVDSSTNSYVTITHQDLHFCDKARVRQCQVAFIYRNLNDNSCFSAMFHADSADRIIQSCDVTYHTSSRITPRVLELSPGILLLYNLPLDRVKALQIDCQDHSRRVPLNSMELALQLPCRCKALAVPSVFNTNDTTGLIPFYLPEGLDRCSARQLSLVKLKVPYNILAEKLIKKLVPLEFNDNFWPDLDPKDYKSIKPTYQQEHQLRTDLVPPLQQTETEASYDYKRLIQQSEQIQDDPYAPPAPYVQYMVDSALDHNSGIKTTKLIGYVVLGLVVGGLILLIVFRHKIGTVKQRLLGVSAIPMSNALNQTDFYSPPRAAYYQIASPSVDNTIMLEQINNLHTVMTTQRIISLVATSVSLVLLIYLCYKIMKKLRNGTFDCPLARLIGVHPEYSPTELYLGVQNLQGSVHIHLMKIHVPARNLAVFHQRKPIFHQLSPGILTSSLGLNWNNMQLKIAFLDVIDEIIKLPRVIQIPVLKNMAVKTVLREPSCLCTLLCEQHGMATPLHLPLPFLINKAPQTISYVPRPLIDSHVYEALRHPLFRSRELPARPQRQASTESSPYEIINVTPIMPQLNPRVGPDSIPSIHKPKLTPRLRAKSLHDIDSESPLDINNLTIEKKLPRARKPASRSTSLELESPRL